MKKTTLTILMAVALIFTANTANANENPDARTIVENSLLAYYYPGTDGKATISMDLIDKSGGIRKREMVMLRLNVGEKGGDQNFFVYFKEPGDVREMTFMVHKHPGENDDRWLFIPSVKLVRRIAADDKRSSFVGSDFVYEDVSGRHIDQDQHSLVKEDKLDGTDVYVIKSVPNDRVEYSYKLSYIRQDNFLSVKEEYFNSSDEIIRVFTAEDIKDIDSLPTPMTRIMENVKGGTRTVITITKADYEIGLKENDFSERRMRKPPRSWIR